MCHPVNASPLADTARWTFSAKGQSMRSPGSQAQPGLGTPTQRGCRAEAARVNTSREAWPCSTDGALKRQALTGLGLGGVFAEL